MTSKRIHSQDRGHDAVGMKNDGKANHQHGKKRGGLAKSPKHAKGVSHGHHPAFGKKGSY